MKRKTTQEIRNKSGYDHAQIEPKWQEVWRKEGTYKTPETPKNKKYILDMYPYPSGASLHVGHVEGYVGTDILARYARMNGFGVLHPMGWDSFGLPAENYAIKTGIHPEESTKQNIETFKRQLSAVGMSYDWDYEITSSDPNYYKWNQLLFTQLFKKGLAYKAAANVNWCPSCETVLANEQVVPASPDSGQGGDGKCERCEATVELKKLDQWFLKITAYADRLIDGLTEIDWLPEVKVQQKNWIGKKEGAMLWFDLAGPGSPSGPRHPHALEVFTTRPDTLVGATFMVVSPEHELATGVELPAVEGEKNGAFTGKYVINPATGKKIPVWVSDYVLADYGTGAIMAVPAHDERDAEFAKKYDLPVVEVETEGTKKEIDKAVKLAEEKGWGKRVTTLHIRDWLISRQRYWGTPIPMIYCQSCASAAKGERPDVPGWYSIPQDQLPVLLPKDVDFNPKGQSPIARSKSFQEGVKCPGCGEPARREVDTMDGYFDSSWYFIRFTDPKNEKEFASREAMEKWLPVDVYVGGGHVVQHLLFARFFWKFMQDAKLIDKSLGEEPFLKLRAPGWILGPDSRKMSKRWGNVITPDDIIPKYGADTLRMYEMFMGPFEASKPWNVTGVEGMSRFVRRVWTLSGKISNFQFPISNEEEGRRVYRMIHKTIKRVTEDIEALKFNTAIAGLMEYVNFLDDLLVKLEGQEIKRPEGAVKVTCAELDEAGKTLLLLMAPFAPYMTEELWQRYFGDEKKYISIHKEAWPKWDEELVIEETINIPIQINGKMRGNINVPFDEAENQEFVENEVKKNENVKKYIEGKDISKVIYVKGRLINFVVS